MRFKLLVAIALATASTLTSAQWYGVVAGGKTIASLRAQNVELSDATANTYDINNGSNGYKLQFGYQFVPNLAVEMGYVNLGKFDITNNVTAPYVGSYRRDLSAKGWTFMFVGVLPVASRFSLLGKIGTINSTTSSERTATGAITVGGDPSSSKSEFNTAYGLGAQFDISKSLAVRVEAETYLDLRPFNNNVLKNDYSLYSVGLVVKF
jgi:OOP family OmpA-OmpF porin